MTTLLESFEKATPKTIDGPLRDLQRGAFMAGAAAAVVQIGAASRAVDPGTADAVAKTVIAISSRCVQLHAELATWALLSRTKAKR